MVRDTGKILSSRISQPFSSQRGGQRNRTMQDFKEFINIRAGGDFSGILSAFYNTRPGKIIKQHLMDLKTKILVSKVIGQYVSAANIHKSLWISLLSSSGFSRRDILQLGFKVGRQSWTNSKSIDLPFF